MGRTISLVFLGGLTVVLLARMAIAFERHRMAPQCWRCGAYKVVKCTRYRSSDYLAMLGLMIPLRCMGCLTRFYGLRGIGFRHYRSHHPSRTRHA